MSAVLVALLLASAADLPRIASVASPDEEFSIENCSLYCAVSPTTAVSRSLEAQGRVHYDASRLDDGRPSTAWVVGGGPGEWFQFTFTPGAEQRQSGRLGVSVVYILNGYAKSPQHWRDHSRVKELELQVDGTAMAVLSLPDERTPQMVRLPDLPMRRTLVLRFLVKSVYPGARFQELAISEVRIDGYGHH